MPTSDPPLPLALAFPESRREAFASYAGHWLANEALTFTPGETVRVAGQALTLPRRINLNRRKLVDSWGCDNVQREHADLVLALGSRHHDGYYRESCVRKLLAGQPSWTLPYVLAPLGEYVLEIGEAILDGWDMLDSGALSSFCADNPALVDRLRRRATSYWDCYYRTRFPRQDDYPPWQALCRLP